LIFYTNIEVFITLHSYLTLLPYTEKIDFLHKS